MKRVLRHLVCIAAVSAAFLLIVSRVEFSLPLSLISYLSDSVSTDSMLVMADDIRVRIPYFVEIHRLRILDRTRAEARPVVSADRVKVELRPWRLRRRLGACIRRVSVSGLKMPRLPDGYYIPDSIEFPGEPDFKEKNDPVCLHFPEFGPFSFQLDDADVLDLKVKDLVSDNVWSDGSAIRISDILLNFPDPETKVSLTGGVTIDGANGKVSGSVHGQARQENIRPMLQALEVTNSYQFIDAFTKVAKPVDAGCRFDVNLANNDLHLFLDLHPSSGCYHGVPFESAQGNVDIRVFVRDTFQNAQIGIGPLGVHLSDGSAMSGTVIYENTNDVGYVSFHNVRSYTSLSNALAIADVLTDGTLDCLQPRGTCSISLDGTMAVDPSHSAVNHIDGSLSFPSGEFFSIPLRRTSTEFKLRGNSIAFTNAVCSLPRGGEISGTGIIDFPGFDKSKASFSVSLSASDISMDDVSELFAIKNDGRSGRISGSFTMSSPFSDNMKSSVSCHGNLHIADGRISRINLFSGLTDYLAKSIPGISSLVDQSEANISFSVANGILKVDELEIRGDVFSISGSGTYSLTEDALDFKVRVQLLKNDTILGKLTNPITWTFSRLLMEFKLFGPISKPDWKYMTVLEHLR